MLTQPVAILRVPPNVCSRHFDYCHIVDRVSMPLLHGGTLFEMRT